MQDLQSLRSLLEARDLRVTTQRLAVLRALLDLKEEHPTAYHIYRKAKEYYLSLGLATVYRTLKLLTHGNVLLVFYFEGEGHYDLKDDHGHFICHSCGKIMDFEDSSRKVTSMEKGFTITKKTVYGYCSDCQKKKEPINHGKHYRKATSK